MPVNNNKEGQSTVFENHLEQAEVLKDQLQMLNGITNQLLQLSQFNEAKKNMEDKTQQDLLQ